MEFITVEQMTDLVERYIYDKKGVSVKININYPNKFILSNQLDKLHYAYNIALDYYNGNKRNDSIQ